MNKIMIDKASKGDFPQIFDLYKQLWPEWNMNTEEIQKVFEEDLKTDSRIYITARQDNKIIGLCTLAIRYDFHYGKIGILDELIVDDNYRRQGIGTDLINKASEIAEKLKCYRLELHSNIKRVEAHKFYEANGFEKTSFYFKKKLATE